MVVPFVLTTASHRGFSHAGELDRGKWHIALLVVLAGFVVWNLVDAEWLPAACVVVILVANVVTIREHQKRSRARDPVAKRRRARQRRHAAAPPGAVTKAKLAPAVRKKLGKPAATGAAGPQGETGAIGPQASPRSAR